MNFEDGTDIIQKNIKSKFIEKILVNTFVQTEYGDKYELIFCNNGQIIICIDKSKLLIKYICNICLTGFGCFCVIKNNVILYEFAVHSKTNKIQTNIYDIINSD